MSKDYLKPNILKTIFIIFLRIIFTASVALCVAFIFYNSAQVAEVSSDISQKFTVIINEVISYLSLNIVLSEAVVRKLAHIAEFALLGFLFTLCLRVYTKRLIAFSAWPLLFGLFIAVCDEFLQRFIPGRSSQIKDIFIDFIGVCGGTAVAICIVFILSFFYWIFFGRKKQKRIKAILAQEKAEIEQARIYLADQKEIKNIIQNTSSET